MPSGFQLTLRSAPMVEVFNKPRVGKVLLDIHLKDGAKTNDVGLPKIPEFPSNEVTVPVAGNTQRVLKFVGGSINEETFTMDSEHTYVMDVPVLDTVESIDGVAVNWIPSDPETKDRLYPRGFVVKNLDVKEPGLRLCRRKASDGIIPLGKYIFRTRPQCFRDRDQTPPKEN